MSTVTQVPERPALSPLPRLAAAVLPVAATAAIGSVSTQNEIDGWYASLTKPAFNPPNWVFPVAWTILYTMIAVSARAGGSPWSPSRCSSC